MTASDTHITVLRAKEAFCQANPAKPQKPATTPFSMRLTQEERAFLAQRCGGRPWASYIREQVFGEQANIKRRAIRRPTINDKALVASLSGLGESRLASNLNQLARHANTGTLEVTRDTEKELEEAYQAVLAMRDALFMALGLRSGGL